MKFKTSHIIMIILVIGGGYALMSLNGKSGPETGRKITIPTLSPLAEEGKIIFDANCASCHGNNAAGSDQGPPLIHDIYNPGHHSDMAFYRAANMGTPQHHWQFGNMPPQKQVRADDVTRIIKYIREIQRANGIVYKQHHM